MLIDQNTFLSYFISTLNGGYAASLISIGQRFDGYWSTRP